MSARKRLLPGQKQVVQKRAKKVKRVPTMTLIQRLVQLEVRGATAIFQPASSQGITLADCNRMHAELRDALNDARRVVWERVEQLDRLEW